MESFDSKQLKKNARDVLKYHYFFLVIIMLIAVMIGTARGGSLDIFRYDFELVKNSSSIKVLEKIASGDIQGAGVLAQANMLSAEKKDEQIGDIQFGHQNGILAELVNKRSSGSFIASLASAVLNITKSQKASSIIPILIALIFIGFESVFVSQVYRVVYTRVFLESRLYKKSNVSSLLFLFRVKKWIKASLSYLYFSVLYILWCFTIVGFFVKHYSYAMTRFIIAENPDLSGKEAVTLSRKMMNGHKWELFKFDLSFFGWYVLSILTFRLLDVFYLSPYREASYAEYYVYLRNLSKANNIEGIDKLNDTYLFETADAEIINNTYSDVIDIMNSPDVEFPQTSKVRAFFQNVLGVVWHYDQKEIEYRKIMNSKANVSSYKNIIEGLSYPSRLCPVKTTETRRHMEHTEYMRHYSVPTMIMIFFIFCFVGWIWEVAIHIVNDGRFVNRGVLHGPWLPIYGVGAVMILLILNVFRKKPIVEFLSAIILCGFVEYLGSWGLEKFLGKKWWDYSGYFLNINGRICAEGLLVFGLAGMAAVYFLAPSIDNCLRNVNNKLLWIISLVLLTVFFADLGYSGNHPNTGEGITDYGDTVSVNHETRTDGIETVV